MSHEGVDGKFLMWLGAFVSFSGVEIEKTAVLCCGVSLEWWIRCVVCVCFVVYDDHRELGLSIEYSVI